MMASASHLPLGKLLNGLRSALLPQATAGIALIALLALALGIWLRVWRVASDGMLDADSAYYTIFADYYRRVIFDHYPLYFGIDTQTKPGFMILATIAVSVLGFESYSLPVLNAVLAAASGLMVYRIAGLFSRGPVAPLIALLFVMFVPYLIDLDRQGLTHGAAVLAILYSVYELLIWSLHPWSHNRKALVRSGLALGFAFLCHPTIFFYVVSLGAIVFSLSVSLTTPNVREKAIPLLVFAISAAVPVLLTELVFRSIFFLWPELIGYRNPEFARFFGFGYIGDLLNHFNSAKVYKQNVQALGYTSGDSAQDPAFFFKALETFRFDVVGMVTAFGVACSSIFLLLRPPFGRRVQCIVLLVAAYSPLVMMAYNPYFGQFARSLHGTLPLLMVIFAIGVLSASQWLAGRVQFLRHWAGACAIVFAVFWAAEGARLFVSSYYQKLEKPLTDAMSPKLADIIFSDLKSRGIDGVYLYQNVFGSQWWFYLRKYFNALPAPLENPKASPPPDTRIISSEVELERLVRSKQAQVVIILIRPRAAGAPFLNDAERIAVERFLNLVPSLGGRELMAVSGAKYSDWARVFQFY